MDDLNEILQGHKKWFHSGGNGGAQADFRGMQLENLDLRKVCLVEANLQGIKLFNSDLRGAELQGANSQDSILTKCDLQKANLKEADLMWAVFNDVNLASVLI